MLHIKKPLALLLSGLFISSSAFGLAEREPNNSVTRADFIARTGNGSAESRYGNYVGQINTNQELVIYATNGMSPTNYTLAGTTKEVSYPRDTMAMYYQLHTARANTEVQIFGTPTPWPWEIGPELAINLPVIATVNGQSIYQINDSTDIGMRVWLSVTSGALSAIRNNSRYFVNNGYAIGSSNNTLGSWFGATRTTSWNANFNVDAEIVLLNPDAVSGTITVPAQEIGVMKIHSNNFQKISGKIDFPLKLGASTFTFKSRTCEYTGSRVQTVKMDKIGVGHFSNRNEVYGGSTEFNLTCPTNTNVDSFISFTDNTTVSNTSNILSLTQDSTAENVGIRVYLNDNTTPVTFSPIVYNSGTEGTAGQAITKNTNTMTQLGSKTTLSQSLPIKLVAKYVKTNADAIVPGTANAEMMFTFSYY